MGGFPCDANLSLAIAGGIRLSNSIRGVVEMLILIIIDSILAYTKKLLLMPLRSVKVYGARIFRLGICASCLHQFALSQI